LLITLQTSKNNRLKKFKEMMVIEDWLQKRERGEREERERGRERVSENIKVK
jgi:hypothetical protein